MDSFMHLLHYWTKWRIRRLQNQLKKLHKNKNVFNEIDNYERKHELQRKLSRLQKKLKD